MSARSRWADTRVLVTGHTGFKGAWLAFWLEQLGAQVFGLSLPPTSAGCAYALLRPNVAGEAFGDVRDQEVVLARFREWRPDVVFHLAAQALVGEGYRNPVETFEINVGGTVNVLCAAAEADVRAAVVVTTDKVYANDESGRPFTEGDPIGAHDPYSTSKACADLAAQSFLATFKTTRVGIARAGNVIGGGDVAVERLLPDARRALVAGRPLALRQPRSVRPWQFVLDPLLGYIRMAEALLNGDQLPAALNFAPEVDACWAALDVAESAYAIYGSGTCVPASSGVGPEAEVLRLDATLARRTLSWCPLTELAVGIAHTVAWWKADDASGDCRALALDQLAPYLEFTR